MQATRIAATAVAFVLAGSLAACGDATKDAADHATPTASAKARDLGNPRFEDVKAKLSAAQREQLERLDTVGLGTKGQLVGDADALTVAEYFGARQDAAANSGEDITDILAISSGQALTDATRYVTRYAGMTPRFSVDVVSSQAGTVTACVGPHGTQPRTLVVKKGTVVTNRPGTHTC